ncbi:rho-type GTPase activating protein Rga1 [Schizosaccharomyces cryophilus OY26]|uniref:Rho-type GTPase activating protein Rga1 n=1 Tax=Schizosaccharomyces cryophilus (strain OY26 / ATCC MYA-4695 / CBS 11777 / NBRC 106824 / NRRL Y48691) TaxID=653667 RepID=S9VW04_SCHCR|nr:rho-type GTPase activating protein Rga1 [Schizosaccharomyces cryophilus OY26]EPY50389.1 rho-type GTPase activating protein Rga1 [Schizosaccharomyces cryophilus OY26]
MSQRDADKFEILISKSGTVSTKPRRVPTKQSHDRSAVFSRSSSRVRNSIIPEQNPFTPGLSRRHTSAESRKPLAKPASLQTKIPSGSSEQLNLKRSETLSPPRFARKPSARTCGACNQTIASQYVRALGNVYHLECFKCYDCGTLVASKFFPINAPSPSGQVPLCETDYFRRLDLLCANCDMALRGYYITALNKKYHIEHFTCTLCNTIFGPNDSYYEHEGEVYCHYHYSTLFAAHCYGCDGPILKQFVEIYRNGAFQNWHVPCHMIYKFWNVKLSPKSYETKIPDIHLSHSQLRKREKNLEQKIFHIWHALSCFEEYTASCISDMLLNVSNGAFKQSVLCAQKFIRYIEILFKGIDSLETALASFRAKSMPYIREAKLLCKKLVSIFALLAKCHNSDIRDVSVVQDFLSLFTGLAHYLKLLIRISLTGGLRLEQEHSCKHALPQFLLIMEESKFVDQGNYDESTLDIFLHLAHANSDLCFVCHTALEEDCILVGEKHYHIGCLSCAKCGYTNRENYDWARWNYALNQIECYLCYTDSSAPNTSDKQPIFQYVSRLSQYTYLLQIALIRLYAILKVHATQVANTPPIINDRPPSSYRLATEKKLTNTEADSFKKYANTLNDLRRLKSSRSLKGTSEESKVIYNPDESDFQASNEDPLVYHNHISKPVDESDKATNGGVRDGIHTNLERRMDAFDENRAFTLDDIPKVIAEQRNREHRPNAFRHMPSYTDSSVRKGNRYNTGSSGQQTIKTPSTETAARYLSELNNLEQLFELMEMSDLRKGGFWEKFGKAFKGKDNDKKSIKKKGTFGVPLEVLVERRNAYSGDLVNKQIPTFIDNTIAAMKKKDMSVVGVFRKNGNIRRLKELSDLLDTSPESIKYEEESPIQLAALLKKFLRELPDPLLTFKLFGLFITSSKLESEEERLRVLHLTICLLPKSHRDTMENIFGFLFWVASFSHIDDEVGSKMDIHNLATVITPNILYSKSNDPVDESFLAIEAVHSLIENFEKFCEVPTEISMLLDDPALFYNNAAWTSKELAKRCEDILTQMSVSDQISSKQVSSTKRRKQPIRKVTTTLTSEFPPGSEVAESTASSSATDRNDLLERSVVQNPGLKPQQAIIKET